MKLQLFINFLIVFVLQSRPILVIDYVQRVIVDLMYYKLKSVSTNSYLSVICKH
jgi:hypothetical protein